MIIDPYPSQTPSNTVGAHEHDRERNSKFVVRVSDLWSTVYNFPTFCREHNVVLKLAMADSPFKLDGEQDSLSKFRSEFQIPTYRQMKCTSVPEDNRKSSLRLLLVRAAF